MQLGDAGDVTAYRLVLDLVNARAKGEGDMGGLKEQFLKLRDQAQAKLEGATPEVSEPKPGAPPPPSKPKAKSKPKPKTKANGN